MNFDSRDLHITLLLPRVDQYIYKRKRLFVWSIEGDFNQTLFGIPYGNWPCVHVGRWFALEMAPKLQCIF